MRDVTSREAELEQALRWALRDIFDLCNHGSMDWSLYREDNPGWWAACDLVGLDPETCHTLKAKGSK